MATIYVKHQVKDFDSWKRNYDEFATVRKDNGVIRASLHRDANDANTVIVMHRFENVGAAESFLNSDELKSAMENSGVVGQPEIWLCEDIEETSH
jgi:quinol monooxygenase YgiN